MTTMVEPPRKILKCPTCGKLTVKLPVPLWESKAADEVEVTCRAGHVAKLKDLR